MSKKMQTLQQALNTSTGKEAKPPNPPPADERPVSLSRAPSRARQMNLTVWLDPDFKTNLRLVQARKGSSAKLQDIVTEALNDLFVKYDVPTVRGD
jgi:hypothetical protein